MKSRSWNDIPALQRDLLERCVVDHATGCWLWTRGTDQDGYGRLSVGGRVHVVTRVVLWAFKGDARMKELMHDNGLEACHTCDNPPCINPNHLFVGTSKKNKWDSIKKGRCRYTATHCTRGHKFTKSNTKIFIYKGTRHRFCRTCSRI